VSAATPFAGTQSSPPSGGMLKTAAAPTPSTAAPHAPPAKLLTRRDTTLMVRIAHLSITKSIVLAAFSAMPEGARNVAAVPTPPEAVVAHVKRCVDALIRPQHWPANVETTAPGVIARTHWPATSAT
jgi:hypothetical protein